MGKKGNSGFSGVDKRFGMGGLNVKGNIDRHQNYLERLDGRLSPIGVFPTPTMWLDANSDNITTVTYAGDERVETWSDKSGNGIDASNFGSDVQKPFYDPTDSEFNDLPAVDFSTNDFLVTADDNKLDVNSTGGFTVYVVFNYDSPPSTYFNFLISRTNGTSWTEGWGIYFYEPFSGTDEIRFFVNRYSPSGAYGRYASIPFVSSVFGTHIIKMVYDEVNILGESFGYTKNSDTEPYTDSVVDPSSGIELCRASSSSYDINGSIGETLFYNRPLSSVEQEEVENYLSEKYDISLT